MSNTAKIGFSFPDILGTNIPLTEIYQNTHAFKKYFILALGGR